MKVNARVVVSLVLKALANPRIVAVAKTASYLQMFNQRGDLYIRIAESQEPIVQGFIQEISRLVPQAVLTVHPETRQHNLTLPLNPPQGKEEKTVGEAGREQ